MGSLSLEINVFIDNDDDDDILDALGEGELYDKTLLSYFTYLNHKTPCLIKHSHSNGGDGIVSDTHFLTLDGRSIIKAAVAEAARYIINEYNQVESKDDGD